MSNCTLIAWLELQTSECSQITNCLPVQDAKVIWRLASCRTKDCYEAVTESLSILREKKDTQGSTLVWLDLRFREWCGHGTSKDILMLQSLKLIMNN